MKEIEGMKDLAQMLLQSCLHDRPGRVTESLKRDRDELAMFERTKKGLEEGTCKFVFCVEEDFARVNCRVK